MSFMSLGPERRRKNFRRRHFCLQLLHDFIHVRCLVGLEQAQDPLFVGWKPFVWK